MSRGTVKFFNETKWFGFIKYEGEDREIFVHTTEVFVHAADEDVSEEEMRRKQGVLRENDFVEFTEAEGQNGKGPQAADVRRIEADQAA